MPVLLTPYDDAYLTPQRHKAGPVRQEALLETFESVDEVDSFSGGVSVDFTIQNFSHRTRFVSLCK